MFFIGKISSVTILSTADVMIKVTVLIRIVSFFLINIF